MGNDIESLSHTKWRCQYHIVFVPKYRRQIIYGKYKVEIGKILRTICIRHGVEIIEANACSDHIHMLVTIPPKMSVSKFMGILKGKSSLMIFDRFANLKYKYGNRHFWCRGYYVDTVGRNKIAIAKYIQNQIQEDQIAEQISMKEYLFKELFYGQQKDVYIHKIYSFNNDIRCKEKLDSIINKYYNRDFNFNYISTTLLSNEEPKLELVVCKSVINAQTNEINKIKMIFAYLIKRYDNKGNLIEEHSYIPIEVDLMKEIVICKVASKTSLYKDNYKPEYLYNKYMDIVINMFELEFNSYNTQHKIALYNMSDELYKQIYNKIISSKSAELNKVIETFTKDVEKQININDLNIKAKEINVFDIKGSINRYFDQLLITDILSSKNIKNSDMEEIDGIVIYLRFSDGTNVSAKVKGENYRVSIYTSETYMTLRDPIENANKVSEIKVIWIENDRNLRVRYNTNSCEYLYMHFYKDFKAKDFEYGYKKYESMVISKATNVAK